MPKRRGYSNRSSRSNKRQTSVRIPTGIDPWVSLRNIMDGVASYAQYATSNHLYHLSYWNSSQENDFMRLCMQDPSLITNIFCVGTTRATPLAFLIQFRAKLALVKALCETFPNALETKSNGLYPLEIACATSPHVTPGIVSFLAMSFPEAACKDLSCSLDCLLDDIDLDDTIMGCNNAEKLDSIKAVIDTAKVLCGFLDDEEDQLLFFQQVIDSGNCYKQRNLMDFVVEQCPDISDLQLTTMQDDPDVIDYEALQDKSSKVIYLTPQLKELEFDVDLDLEEVGTWQRLMYALGNASRLEALRLEILDWPTAEEQKELCAAALYDALVSIPNLKKLYLCGCHDSGGRLGETLTSLLRHKNLEVLIVLDAAPGPNHKPILAALEENTSLKCFGVGSCVDTEEKKKALLGLLTGKNTTLQQVITLDKSWMMEQISYLCILNELGRGIARDPFTSAAALVVLLEETVEKSFAIHDFIDSDDMPDAGGLEYIYGLLRECPSIWSE